MCVGGSWCHPVRVCACVVSCVCVWSVCACVWCVCVWCLCVTCVCESVSDSQCPVSSRGACLCMNVIFVYLCGCVWGCGEVWGVCQSGVACVVCVWVSSVSVYVRVCVVLCCVGACLCYEGLCVVWVVVVSLSVCCVSCLWNVALTQSLSLYRVPPQARPQGSARPPQQQWRP